MTAYFDSVGAELNAIARHLVANVPPESYEHATQEKLQEIENRVVFDVTLCAEWEGCPEDIRDAIHRNVLRFSPEAQPPGVHGPDYEDQQSYVRGVSQMCSNFHDIFHALAHRHLEAFSDNPKAPVRGLFGKGDDRRTRMCPVPVAYWRRSMEALEPEERGPQIQMLGQYAYDHAFGETKDAVKAEAARAETMAALAAPVPAQEGSAM